MMLCVVLAALPLLKAPEAPFVDKPVELETPMLALKSDRIEAGTKQLVWRNLDENLAIFANGRIMALFQTRVSPSFPGWQPIRKFAVSVESNAVTRVCPFGLTKDAGGVFTQRFAVEGGCAVWDSQFAATNDVPVKGQTMTVLIPRDCVKGRKVLLKDKGGRVQTVQAPLDDAWDTREDRKKPLWETMCYCGNPAEITVDPDHPEFAFTLRFAPGVLRHVLLFRSLAGLELYYTFRDDAIGKTLRQEVAFGQVAKPVAGDCVVNGINFTQSNDFEVTRWGRRNLLNNPSFEADARYWHGVSSAAMCDRKLVPDAHSGTCGWLLGGGYAFAVPTKANTRLTFSCWAKSLSGEGGTVVLGAIGYTGGGNLRNKTLELKRRTKDWQRLTHTFDWPHRGLALQLSTWRQDNVVIDDVQLEEGEVATDFECPPFATVLKTDSPDRYYGDESQVFNPRLVVRGKPGAKAVAKISVKDFFGRATWKGETPFEIGAAGEAEFPACPEAAVAAKGVNVIRVEIDAGDGRPVVDHLRVVRYRFAKGDEPNTELHQNEGFGWATRYQLKYDPVNWHRVRTQGLNVFSRDLGDWWGLFDTTQREAIAAWYANHGGRIKQEVFPHAMNREKPSHPIYHYLNEEGIPWENMPKTTKGYGAQELAAVERAVERLVRENPWCTDWIGTSEIGVQWDLTKTHNYKDYAKIMMAAHRAIKRVNPKARFIAHGTCNAGQQGRAELHEFMEATLAVDPNWAWDGLQVHPYRAHPEFPSLEMDLKLLFADMAKHNMPDGLVFADEGAYFHPMLVKEWGMAPWAGVQETDRYCHMHAAGFDLGWGERVATAMLMRYNLQCYRFIPRIKYVTSWNLRTLDTYTPWAVYLGTATETELLGYATYVKDVRFGDGARAYFFDDHKGNAVAAVWRFNVALDKGLEKASEMYVDAEFLKSCEIFDMMGNRCEAEKALPLSNFPFFLRVPIAKMDALVKAVETCRTSDDGKVKKIYDPAPVAIPHCGEKPDWSAVAPVKLANVQLEPAAKRAGRKWEGEKDFAVECRMAWNEKGLWLKVDAKDDRFVLDRSTYRFGETQWYACEGVQVFFDCLGDARDNLRLEMSGFDENDSSYELLPTSENAAIVYRRLAPDIQQTGGVADPLKADVVVPEIRCDFKWDAAKGVRTYEVFFPARQLQPMTLKAGAKIGCSFTAFDRDAPGREAKQTATGIPAGLGSAYQRPHLYGSYILK